VSRNNAQRAHLEAAFGQAGLVHDLPRSLRIAAWAYETAAGSGLPTWHEGRAATADLGSAWNKLLAS
jgi:hypothetical protein